MLLGSLRSSYIRRPGEALQARVALMVEFLRSVTLIGLIFGYQADLENRLAVVATHVRGAAGDTDRVVQVVLGSA